MGDRHIVALGGYALDPLIAGYVRSLARPRERPRICLLPTACGDHLDYIVRFYQAFPSSTWEPSHIALHNVPPADLHGLIVSQDAILVSGGNTANLLAVLRLHGVDRALREGWEGGTVMFGSSAGMICWFEDGVTDSWGPVLDALGDGLGFLPGSACPHYDGEPERRPTYQRLIAQGFPAGLAADDGAGLHFEGTELRRVVSCRPEALGYRVERDGDAVRETPLETEYLAG